MLWSARDAAQRLHWADDDSAESRSAAEKAKHLRALHEHEQLVVLPNAWDAASAREFEHAGFPAVATTSAGVSQVLGFADGQRAPVDQMLAAAKRMADAVEVPVSVDFEAGYGLAPEGVVQRLLKAGASGFNLEDGDHSRDKALLPAEPQAGLIAALKAAGREVGVDLVLNARVDVFIQGLGGEDEQAREGLRRARLYKDAGADCIYPITLDDKGLLAEFVASVGAINVNLRSGGPLTLADVAALGVRRVSYSTSIFRVALATTKQLAEQIRAEQIGL